jgi:integrase
MARALDAVSKAMGADNVYQLEFEGFDSFSLTNIKTILMDHEPSYSFNTINLYLSAVKGVLRTSFQYKRMSLEQYASFQFVKGLTGKTGFAGAVLPQTVCSEIFDGCDDGTIIGIRDAAIFGVMLSSGLRRNELASLQLSDYDPLAPKVTVIGKGNKKRSPFLHPKIKDRLDYYISQVRGEEPGPLFYRIRRGNVVTNEGLLSNGIYYICRNRAGILGIDDIRPHNLRRTFATALYDKGESLIMISKLLGHSSVETTKRYLDINIDVESKAAANLLDF